MYTTYILYSCNVIILTMLCTTMTCDAAKYECRHGIYQCHLDPWEQWSHCSASCGGGVSKRYKPLCCDHSYTEIAVCASDCNLTRSDYFESKQCGQTCVNGVFKINVCQCPTGYTGTCCESSKLISSTYRTIFKWSVSQ